MGGEPDSHGGQRLSDAGTKLVVPVTGYYLFNAYVHWTGAANGIRIFEWRKNGSVYVNGSNVQSLAAISDVRQEVSALLLLNAGDYMEATVFQNTGSTLTFIYFGCSVAQIKVGS